MVDVDKIKAEGGEDDRLPLYYDPELIAVYWRRRPAAVAQRILQLLSIAGGFITGIVSDIVRGETEKNSVKRAIQLREIVTSLGPAYIKLGQALSIRPDILSPQAMTELQKLCDKVPSFDNRTAFDCAGGGARLQVAGHLQRARPRPGRGGEPRPGVQR